MAVILLPLSRGLLSSQLFKKSRYSCQRGVDAGLQLPPTPQEPSAQPSTRTFRGVIPRESIVLPSTLTSSCCPRSPLYTYTKSGFQCIPRDSTEKSKLYYIITFHLTVLCPPFPPHLPGCSPHMLKGQLECSDRVVPCLLLRPTSSRNRRPSNPRKVREPQLKVGTAQQPFLQYLRMNFKRDIWDREVSSKAYTVYPNTPLTSIKPVLV